MSTTPVRVFLFFAVASAVGCEALQRSGQNGSGGSTATGPSALRRVVDDVGADSTSGAETTGDCQTPPCTPPPPRPQPVDGDFVLTSADRSTISFPYRIVTTPSGLPEAGFGNSDTKKVEGTGRFAELAGALIYVDFNGGTAAVSLKWSIAQKGIPDGYRSYGDSGTFPYSSRMLADSSCASGSRFTAEIPGRMENIGRFTAAINHCVSPVQ